jgi:hypothetical protein
MSALSLRLPNSLHEAAKELASREGISVNQLVATALAEKLAALTTAEYFEKRAKRGSRAKFLAALAKVPDVEPPPWDRLPPEMMAPKGRKPAKPKPSRRAGMK